MQRGQPAPPYPPFLTHLLLLVHVPPHPSHIFSSFPPPHPSLTAVTPPPPHQQQHASCSAHTSLPLLPPTLHPFFFITKKVESLQDGEGMRGLAAAQATRFTTSRLPLLPSLQNLLLVGYCKSNLLSTVTPPAPSSPSSSCSRMYPLTQLMSSPVSLHPSPPPPLPYHQQ